MLTLFYKQGNKDRNRHFWRLTLWVCTEQMGWVWSLHAFEVLKYLGENLKKKEVRPQILKKELVFVL